MSRCDYGRPRDRFATSMSAADDAAPTPKTLELEPRPRLKLKPCVALMGLDPERAARQHPMREW